jgi:hypothetical protein
MGEPVVRRVVEPVVAVPAAVGCEEVGGELEQHDGSKDQNELEHLVPSP